MTMHKYRTHNCNELSLQNEGSIIRLSGWIHRKRDHGNLLFIDLRDHYGITQIMFTEQNQELRELASHLKLETVITVTGKVVKRSIDSINQKINSGEIEVIASEINIESSAENLPLIVSSNEAEEAEMIRLKYRFLDLRRQKLHQNIILRSKVINHIRKLLTEANFLEITTPILTSSSPEGARDFLVPSRLHHGKFYALPQSPQQFKQLLMVAGFDRYFQIAPCFRDEDTRADRSFEFYQCDIEMSFVTEEDIFSVIEPVLYDIFVKFSKTGYNVSSLPFVRIPYHEAMLKYGTDKPDLRNPLIIGDVTDIFKNLSENIITSNIKDKSFIVRAISAPNISTKPRSFFQKSEEFAKNQGSKGLGYIIFTEEGEAKGPLVKFFTDNLLAELREKLGANNGDVIFFISDEANKAAYIAGKIRDYLAQELDLIEKNSFKFCWITDFPFYEINNQTGKIDFSHNPFSMPRGGLAALQNAKNIDDLLAIKAHQYDIVCNGIELSSGAIRNHKPEVMYEAFKITGYSKQEVEEKFGGMLNAFKFGAPPHGGLAPGIDRIIMLLAETPNIREVIAFPLNQQGEDLLMNAPSHVDNRQLKELAIAIKEDKKT